MPDRNLVPPRITREDEPSEPWGECEYCARRFPLRELKSLDRIETCDECRRDMEGPDAEA